MTLFYGWGSTASRLPSHFVETVYLLFTNKWPEISGTHLIDLGRMKKAESTLEPPSGFEHETPGLVVQLY